MQRSRSTSSSIANHPSRTSIESLMFTASTSARSISAPVASPPACTTRASECPPSRARSSSGPSGDGSVSKCAPRRASSRTRSGPSVTRMRTASESQRPAPAVSVSTRCRSGVSGAASAAATPPCAYRVAECESSPLVRTSTDKPRRAAWSAVVSPATPLPNTRTSYTKSQPRWRVGWSRIQTRFEPARCTASSASIGRFASSTCTIRGAYAASSASS